MGWAVAVLLVGLLLPVSADAAPSAAGGWLPGPGAAGENTYDGYIDLPAADAQVGTRGAVQVSGWVVDRTAQGWAGADDVEIFLGLMSDGGTLLGHAFFAQPRPDVGAALGSPYWAASGWTAAIPTSALVPGSNTLSVYTHSPTKGWWYKQVTVSVGSGATSQGVASSLGYDLSYPECAAADPGRPAFGIVGVNGGRAFTGNPCLAREYSWALTATSPVQPHLAFYMNTGNPGPGASPHWPAAGTVAPQPCDGSANGACAYDYGWLAAQDAVARARAVAGGLATQVPWWLDVEVENSWSADTMANSADLQGAVAYLRSVGVASVGIYALSTGWEQIIGTSAPQNGPFAALLNWRPGARSIAEAPGWCARTVTGGRVKFTQYPLGGFDANYPCF